MIRKAIIVAAAVLAMGAAAASQQPMAVPAQQSSPAPQGIPLSTNTVPGTTVSTTGPVTSSTTIETGTLAGQVLLWLTSAFGTVLGTVAVGWIVRLFKLAGINATDAMRARLQQIVVNGLNAGAAAVAGGLVGKGSVAVKQPIVAVAVRYVQEHGAEELKALGVDPASDKAIEAIKARIETAIADPAVPTPAVLTPTPAPASALSVTAGSGGEAGGSSQTKG
jgi:hypothetical protein